MKEAIEKLLKEKSDKDSGIDLNAYANGLNDAVSVASSIIEEKDKEIAELKERLQNVFNVGMNGIRYVGSANYASREREAKDRLDNAMFDQPPSIPKEQ